MLIKPPRELLKALKDPDAGTRRAAAERLGFLQEVQAVKPLCDALQDPDSKVRRTAVDALQKIGIKTPAVIDALIARLDDPDPDVRYWVAYSLDTLGDPRAAEPILHAMDKYDQPKLVTSLKHLPLGQNAVVPLGKALQQAIDQWHHLEQVITDFDELAHTLDPRNACVEAFQRIKDAVATPSLVKLLRESSNVREFVKAIYLSFEAIGGPALPFLIEALKDPDPRGKDEILCALGVLGDINALHHLLTEITLDQALLILEPALDPRAILDREPGTRSVRKMGWAAAQLFLDRLKAADARIRAVAVRIISHARDPHAIPFLLEALRNETDHEVQQCIIWGFQVLPDPSTINVLLSELEGENYQPAQLALVAIGPNAQEALLVARNQARPEIQARMDWVLDLIPKSPPQRQRLSY